MTMSTLFSIISVIAGFALSMTATALLAAALFPGWVGRARQRAAGMPVRTFVLGLVVGAILLAIGIFTMQVGGPVGVAGAAVVAGTFGLALCGSAGVAMSIGAALPSPADEERPWKAIIRGWVVLSLASLTPVLGWFFVLPITLLMGLGAAVLGLFRPRAPRGSARGPFAESSAEFVDSERVELVVESRGDSESGAAP